MRLFVFIAKITTENLLKLKGRTAGNAEEGEHIIIDVVELEKLTQHAPDMKTMCAYHLYRELPERVRNTPTHKSVPGYLTIDLPPKRG